MNATKKPYRKRHLFARPIGDVVKEATKPLMHQQGKLMGALLRDWATIVGPERAAVTQPERVQFIGAQAQEATLHLAVRPAAAPELAYVIEQLLEQCARYFGYRAIGRIVLHPTHGRFEREEESPSAPALPVEQIALPSDIPPEMRGIFTRIAARLGSPVVKKDETR